MSNTPVKISAAHAMISSYIKCGLVPMLKGSPGCGKSQLVHSIAKEYNLQVIDLRLSQCDPTDLAGFPTIVNEKADYMPMKHFPIAGDALPRDENGNEMAGWLLFLDEATSAPPAIQAAAYKLILDRQVGTYHLHKKVAIVAAGNLETDNAVVESMSTALQSRLAHITLQTDSDEWIEWAVGANIDYRITSYIRFKPTQLYTFRPDHSDDTYACPRTWEFANRILGKVPDGAKHRLEMLAGVLSEGVAREFNIFMKIFDKLPTIDQIIANPEKLEVPVEPSIQYAITGSISAHATKENVGRLVTYVHRLPVEFQMISMREMIRRNKELLNTPVVQAWISKSATTMF